MAAEKQILLEKEDLARTVARMAHEIVERTAGAAPVLIGIRSRGVHLARRLARKIAEFGRAAPAVGAIDITRFRDDGAATDEPALLSPREIPVAVDDRTVVLVDDVIYRGRTIRAAMQAVARFGNPARVLLAVLIDRGARELPIRADIVGRNLEADDARRITVLLEESDGVDQVVLTDWPPRVQQP
ncbi:MAG TPA: bifunctional pyr operon transcriptional regulator/uracil phosphoribosyltransferase PyrR [candidate division Zixibacteria bacterium]|nr:bifunctional pyr operon transcriptional regulator/uracil phosphoribosyltransferase PyrR [candidate division Zixibacteria bacterium]